MARSHRLAAVAVACSVVAALLAFGVLSAARDRAVAGTPLHRVAVVRTAVGAGALVAPSTLSMRAVPASAVPPDALRSTTDAVGLVTRIAIRPGTVLTAAMLQPASPPDSLSSRATTGQRVIQLDGSRIAGITDAVRAGDHLQVLAGFPTDVYGHDVVRPVLDDVVILAIGHGDVVRDGQRTRSFVLTLALTPPQVPALLFAMQWGSLGAVIRGAR